MKKFLLLSALVSSVLLAGQKQYEISPMIAYNIAEGNIGIKDDGYNLAALEIQFNSLDSKISPEFSILYAPKADYVNGGDTSITRGAFNGVYSFDEINKGVPFVKAGVGIENVSNETTENQGGFFLDIGAGIKYNFTDNIALKAEAIYLAKVSGNHNKYSDNNLLTMVGITFAFGDMEPEVVVVEEEVTEEEEVVVVAPVVVEADDDNDGVLNSADQCPNTASGVAVDEKGCDLDTDKDGVVNAQDICPNTPLGAEVNSDGCPKEVTLHINFATNSAKIEDSSSAFLDKYADFLTTYTNYSAHIIGHTDDRGDASYNKKLSEKRAAAVVTALIARGVDPKQLSSEGMGEENPIADNSTAEGRSQNRRIEAQLTRH